MISFTDYRLEQREYLLRIARAMASELALSDLLRLVIEHAVSLLTGQAGLIALRRGDDTFGVVASYGIERETLRRFAPLLQTIPVESFEAERLVQARPWLRRRLAAIASSIELDVGDAVAMPLNIGDRLIGVIFIFRGAEAQFSLMDRQLLADFADMAAVAVRNAQLFQQVMDERRQLQTLVAHTEEGVAILDPGGQIALFNRALASMTGWPVAQAQGQLARDVIRVMDDSGNTVRAPDIPAMHRIDEDHVQSIEGWLIRRGGLRGPYVEVTLSPLYDNSGKLFSIVVNFQDVTRFKEAEDLQSTFISVISHELKTPLALITGYAETLDRHDIRWDSDTVHECLTVIRDESKRLDRLIEDLLDAARIEAGALKLRMSYVRLDELAESTVEALRPLQPNHVFELHFPTDWPTVRGDPERLRQMLRNLLNNAVKYSPTGGTIRVGGRVERNQIRVFVADEGPGIPESEHDLLFQRFMRGSGTRDSSGTGLGLYLSKAIIDAHGGAIWVDSTPGQGATFYFALPLDEQAAPVKVPRVRAVGTDTT
jgi:PAS domain S-box-containing protein